MPRSTPGGAAEVRLGHHVGVADDDDRAEPVAPGESLRAVRLGRHERLVHRRADRGAVGDRLPERRVLRARSGRAVAGRPAPGPLDPRDELASRRLPPPQRARPDRVPPRVRRPPVPRRRVERAWPPQRRRAAGRGRAVARRLVRRRRAGSRPARLGRRVRGRARPWRRSSRSDAWSRARSARCRRPRRRRSSSTGTRTGPCRCGRRRRPRRRCTSRDAGPTTARRSGSSPPSGGAVCSARPSRSRSSSRCPRARPRCRVRT